MPEIIGYDRSAFPSLHEWVQVQLVSAQLQIRYAIGRLECWYGIGIDVRKNLTLIKGLDDPKVKALGNQFLPEWNSAILFKYTPGVEIKLHRDPCCFADWAVIVNIGEADFIEYEDNREVVTHLEDGAIIRFNTQNLHGVKPINKTRYSLLFRDYLHKPSKRGISEKQGLTQHP